jgi:hypothetical protein
MLAELRTQQCVLRPEQARASRQHETGIAVVGIGPEILVEQDVAVVGTFQVVDGQQAGSRALCDRTLPPLA